MLNLPKSTEVSLPLYKKDILQNFEGTRKQKDAFNSCITSMKIVNELSPRSLPIEPSKDINGIFIIEVMLKTQDIKQDTIDLIFRLIPQHIVLALHYEDSIRLVVHQTKTFMTDWLPEDYNLIINGLSIDEVWKHIVEVIGNFKVSDGKSLDFQIEQNSKIQAILKEIEKLIKEKEKSKTPTRKYDLNCRIHFLQEEIRRL